MMQVERVMQSIQVSCSRIDLREYDAATPLTLTIEPGAVITILDRADKMGTALQDLVIDIKPGAQVMYIIDHQLHGNNDVALSRTFYLHKASNLTCIAVITGAGRAKATFTLHLVDEHARARVRGLYVINGTEHFEINTVQEHASPRSSSDLIFKGVVQATAKVTYTGMIHIDEKAHFVSASQENKNILLSPYAQAQSIPSLQVLADHVKCAHGSAVGYFDPYQLFYMQARGFTAAHAQQLLLEGFFAEIIHELPADMVDDIRSRCMELIASR